VEVRHDVPCTTHYAQQPPLDLVVVLHSWSENLDKLPYDLLQAGRRLHFNLGDLFPNLSSPVVAALDWSDLDSLFDAQMQHLSSRARKPPAPRTWQACAGRCPGLY
jgi:hypothetical protein